MEVWKLLFLFIWVLLKFNVNFPGCSAKSSPFLVQQALPDSDSPCLTKISPSIKLGPTKSGDRSASCCPEAIRVLSANTSLKDSKPIQTPQVIFLGLLFAKVFTRTWWYLTSYYSTPYNYYTNNLHDLHWLLYGIQRSWQCSIVLQLAWTSHVQVLHTDAST